MYEIIYDFVKYQELLSVHDRKFLHREENKVITNKIYNVLLMSLVIKMLELTDLEKWKKHMKNMFQKQHPKKLC